MKVHLIKIGEPIPGEAFRERRMSLLGRSLAERGNEVVWWTSDICHQNLRVRNRKVVDANIAKGFRLELIKAPKYKKNISVKRFIHHAIFALKVVMRLHGLPKGDRPDVLWVCFPVIPVAFFVSVWAKLTGTKIIFDIRDLSPDIFTAHVSERIRPLVNLVIWPLRLIVKKAFRSADGLVGVSAGYLSWAQGLVNGTSLVHNIPSEVIPLGYKQEPQSSTLSDDVALKLSGSMFFTARGYKLIYAGSLGTSYDLLTVIEGFRVAQRDGFLGQLLIAGGGVQEETVASLAAEVSNVTFLGWIADADLRLLLSKSDIGLMAYSLSATQGLPNKIYEYIGNSLAVLSSLKGECESFLRNNDIGLSYEPGMPSSLSRLLLKLQQEPERVVDMAKNAESCFLKGYEQSKTTEQMIEFIFRVTKNYN
jgi:glycosyltransferase involved in cell wall biosynthesis